MFEHVGFKPDWVEYAIDDATDYLWKIIDTDESVRFALTMEKMDSDGDYYQDAIYHQRFYKKWIFEGKDVTMVFCNPGVDGINWFRIFDNTKRIK